MQKNKSIHRAWNLIRLAILWARKRRVFRKRLMELRLFPKFLKSLTFKHSNRPKAITFREEQFSFDETPGIIFKKLSRSSMRFKIPCIRRARVDFDYDYDFEYDFVGGNNDDDEARKSFLKDEDGDYNNDGDDDDDDDYDNYNECHEVFEEMAKCDGDEDVEDGEEIDAKAEHFIAQFYEQMKLQRQLSYVQYNEMLDRSIS